ncbi:MAG: glutamate 5-kinase [Gammaproteobacteria bacterium]|nr:MAG: glutamate 5-kinase [Gammaproteobacteria bacterium]
MKSRSDFKKAKRVVVKIGSALLTDGGQGLDYDALSSWVEQISELQAQGVELLLVSSGAVAEGMSRLGWTKRPSALNELQVAASVGQMGLVEAWSTRFQAHGVQSAQVLLTHEDLSDRQRYLNARSALLAMLDLSVVPIINENDVVATDEIRFGDNDTLAALVANIVDADLLVILTDQLGLFDSDPTVNSDAVLIEEISADDESLEGMAGASSHSGLGRGGMATKISAARLASRSGTATIIVSGAIDRVINRLYEGELLGTFLIPDLAPLDARKRWLLGRLRVSGELDIDEGAVAVLKKSGKSLLAIGVVSVKGHFKRGDLVLFRDKEGVVVGRGLVNYSAEEVVLIMRQASSEIERLLGYVDEPELCHRDNLVVL